jgi:hypothetical protein
MAPTRRHLLKEKHDALVDVYKGMTVNNAAAKNKMSRKTMYLLLQVPKSVKMFPSRWLELKQLLRMTDVKKLDLTILSHITGVKYSELLAAQQAMKAGGDWTFDGEK